MAEDDAIAPKSSDENGETIPLRRMRSVRRDSNPEESLISPKPSTSQRKKVLTRQATSFEAPVDSSGAMIITPWW